MLVSPSGGGFEGFSHEAGWCNAPPIFSFYSRNKKRKRAVHGPKEKNKGMRFTGARLGLGNKTGMSLPAAQCKRGFWWASNRQAPILVRWENHDLHFIGRPFLLEPLTIGRPTPKPGPPPQTSEAFAVGRGGRNGAELSPPSAAEAQWAEFLPTSPPSLGFPPVCR